MTAPTMDQASTSEPNDASPQQIQPMSNNQQSPPNSIQNPMPPIPPLPVPPRLRSASSFIRPSFNLPREDLLARRDDYIDICVPLYNASVNGDWEAANLILGNRQELVRFSITENHETALHIAASVQNIKFVEELVSIMENDDLELQNKNGNTPLCLAALAGNKKLAEILVNKNSGLLTIRNGNGMMPLYLAALFGNHDTVKYLYENSEKMTGDNWTSVNRGWVFLKCVEADLFDIALNMLEDNSELAQTKDVLGVLARKPHAYIDRDPHFFRRAVKLFFGVHVREKESEAMKLLRIIWEHIMKMSKDEIDKLLRGPPMKDKEGKLILKDEKPIFSSRVLFVAAEMGNTKFVVELIRQYPDLIWKKNDNDQSIFHIAVSHRQESIYNILHEIGSMKDLIVPLKDPEGNNMLHLVGKNAEKNRLHNVSGVAFQMQWELLWFKEVEAMIPIKQP